jgi:hypothetical protein
MKPPLRKATRTSDQESSKKVSNSVRLEPEAARLLKAQTKKLRLTEVRFASAAITYFAETGLDPTVERPQGLHDLGAQLREEARVGRALNVEIAGRLISFLQGYEKNLYAFLQQQQGGTLNYLEQIENTLLRHQVAIESKLIMPMVEYIFQANLDANTTRGLVTRLFTDGLKDFDLNATRSNTSRWTSSATVC